MTKTNPLKIVFFLGLFALMQQLYAQERSLSGIVKDATGETLPGVAVAVKNQSHIGTITDMNGNFMLSVPEDARILVFSFVGMVAQEVDISERNNVEVVLQQATQTMDEVMVVAYGKATKSSFTGSATKVEGAKLELKNTTEITNALQGEVAGVQIINSSGQPGTTSTVRIRGFGSVNSGRAPLYVIDGVPFSGDLSSIAPSDIASTTVLKDATATALYGSRGANGVILITTKQGEKGESNIDVDVKYGINMRLLPLYNTVQSPEEFVELTWEGLYNQYQINPDLGDHTEMESRIWASEDLFSDWGIHPYYNLWNVEGKEVIDPTTGRMNRNALRRYTPGNWQDEMFSNGKRTEANLKISGGADRTSYYTSFGYINDEGYYVGSDYQRFSMRSNVSHRAREWLRGDLGMSYAYSESNSPGQSGSANNGFNFVNNIPAIYPIFERDAEGYIIKDKLLGGNKYDYGFGTDRARGFSANINPAGATQLDVNQSLKHQFSGNALLEARISNHLKFSTTFGLQALTDMGTSLTNMFYGDAAGLGRVSKSTAVNLSYTWNQILAYNHTWGKHNVDAFLAHENTFTQNKSQLGSQSGLANPFGTELSNAIIKGDIRSSTIEYALESYFGQLKYDFNNTYFTHLTIRRDGTSRFPNDKWGTFGSIGAAWMISNEGFLSDQTWINQLKYKISYGILGNQSLGIYPTYDAYAINNLNDELSINFSSKGNPDLTWENSKNFNTGIETRFFNRIGVDVEYFRKITDNLLYYKQVATSLGYASYPVNDGKLLNSGIEFTVDVAVVNSDNFRWNMTLNGAKYNNEILVMPIDDTLGKPKNIEYQGGYAYAKGRSIYDFYMREWAGVDAATGSATWYRYYNELPSGDKEYITDMASYTADNTLHKLGKEATSDYNEATRKFLDKSAVPVLSGGLNVNLGYKALTFDMQFAYSFGGYSYDGAYAQLMGDHAAGSNNWHTDIRKRWQKEGDKTEVPRLTANYDTYDAATSSRFVTSNSFFNLTNIRLSYQWPRQSLQKIGLKGLTLWMAGDNIFMLTSRKGFVPNTSESGNSSAYTYTPLSTYSMGIKVQF